MSESATAALVAAWSRDDLRRMALDRQWGPPPLGLKRDVDRNDKPIPGTEKVEIRREYNAEQKVPFIKKKYLHLYAKRVNYERHMLEAVGKLDALRAHVVDLSGVMNVGRTNMEVLTRWRGLSVRDWDALLDEESPFRRSCVAVLGLVRAILTATREFHRLGFVHCDLLLHNLVMEGVFPDGRRDALRLLLNTTRLIDLEFTLPPLSSLRVSGLHFEPREWPRDTNGDLIWLDVRSHSPNLRPGAIDDKDGPLSWRDMDAGAQQRLERIDWGVDFFSMAHEVEKLLGNTEGFKDERSYPEVVPWLTTLPARLRAWDKLVELDEHGVPRPRECPHRELLDQIAGLMPSEEELEMAMQVAWPPADGDLVRRAASTEQDHRQPKSLQHQSPRPVPPMAPTRPTSSPRSTVKGLGSVEGVTERWERELLAKSVRGPRVRTYFSTIHSEIGSPSRGPTMAVISMSADGYMMGSPRLETGHYENELQHAVHIAHPFAMGVCPITFAQWDAFVSDAGYSHIADDLGWGRGGRPAIHVSWVDAQRYLNWLNSKAGLVDLRGGKNQHPNRYRLPSESEWEYAARAGATQAFGFKAGVGLSHKAARYDWSTSYDGSPTSTWEKCTLATGTFAPNAFGLLDMHGNVWEWVEDAYEPNYALTPSDGSPHINEVAPYRVHRGGAWDSVAADLRVSNRDWNAPDHRGSNVGFRVAQSIARGNE